MKLRFTQGVIIAAMAAGVSLSVLAADQTRTQDRTKAQDQAIYGSTHDGAGTH
jgi:uncharacterized membrane protein